jgi:hypothetical protein
MQFLNPWKNAAFRRRSSLYDFLFDVFSFVFLFTHRPQSQNQRGWSCGGLRPKQQEMLTSSLQYA